MVAWRACGPGGLLLLALISPGCFGSCGGCSDEGVGSKLFDKLKAVDEASGGALSEPKADPAGEAPRGAGGFAARDLIDDPRLAKVTRKLVDERLKAKGYARIACEEQSSDEELAVTFSCRYKRGSQILQLTLMDYRDRDLFIDEVEAVIFEPGARLAAGGRVLSLQLTDRAAAKKLLASLFTQGAVPRAEAARQALKKAGFEVIECVREDEEEMVELECIFVQDGALMGEYAVVRLDDPDDADPEAYEDELAVGAVLGRAEATLTLFDQQGGRALLRELFPELLPKPGSLLVKVFLEDEKHDGRDWDAAGGLPDPFIEVNGVSYRAQRCRNSLDCVFVVPAADKLSVSVFDADAAADDPAGQVTCAPDRSCEARDAVVTVTSMW